MSIFAEIDGSTIAVVTTVFGPLMAYIGHFFKTRLDRLEAKLESCTEQHAVDRELIGGLKSSVQILKEQHGGRVKEQVESCLQQSTEKAEAIVAAGVEAKANGTHK